MARSLFAEAKAKVDKLREEHKQLSQRIAKTRKTDSDVTVDGAGVPVDQVPPPAGASKDVSSASGANGGDRPETGA
eukprot:4777596-Pyramimonas_sp.AAC.1